jgi:flagellar assembly protein FliH
MVSVIRGDEKTKHTISSFVFGDLDNYDGEDSFKPFSPPEFEEGESEAEKKPNRETPLPIVNTKRESDEAIKRRDEMINSLLEKSDNLSYELQSLQRKMDEQERLFQSELKSLKSDAYERGVQDGYVKAKNDADNQYSDSISQLHESIAKLEKLSETFSSMRGSFEKELVHTSVAIAKEVISTEVGFNSGEVAINLAKSLLQNVEEAKEITLHVNGGDYETLKSGFANMEHIEIVPDRAVSKGGIIVVTDVGTIEGNIMERFKEVKSDILSKVNG